MERFPQGKVVGGMTQSIARFSRFRHTWVNFVFFLSPALGDQAKDSQLLQQRLHLFWSLMRAGKNLQTFIFKIMLNLSLRYFR